jgi:hypothetical protein
VAIMEEAHGGYEAESTGVIDTPAAHGRRGGEDGGDGAVTLPPPLPAMRARGSVVLEQGAAGGWSISR